jgi:hypothetical protein
MALDTPLAFSHGPIVQRLRDRTLIPFLGAAASFVGADKRAALPDGDHLAKELLEGIVYPGSATDALTKIAQFLEEGPADRQYLLGKLSRRFDEAVGADYSTAFMEFLAGIPAELIPPLIITTNYDVLVERALEKRGCEYLALSQVRRGNKYAGRWLCYSTLSAPLTDEAILPMHEVEERLKAQQLAGVEDAAKRVVWVFKIHGTARVKVGADLLDSIVLTESDYIDFLARDILKAIPAQITTILRKCSLLFLGYALADWNFRVLLQRIRMLQQASSSDLPRHWAFLLHPEAVESQFWKLRGVNVYDVSLDTCLTALRDAVRPAQA